MKFLKVFALSFISATFLLSSTVFAIEKSFDDNIDNLLKDSSIKCSDDYNDFKKISDSSLTKIREISNYSQSLDKNYNVHSNDPRSFSYDLSFDENKSFKIYKLDTPDFVEYFNNNGNFKNNISKNYNWMSPVYENGNLKHIATFSKNHGDFEMIGFIENVNSTMFESFINLDKLKETLKKNNLTTPSEIKFVKVDKYHINLIYIRQNNQEYAIPFTNTVSKMNIDNGNVYMISNLANKLSNYSITKSSSNDKQGGGTNIVISSRVKSLATSLVFLSASLLLFLNFKKRKNTIK
ncbi:hypothetical protein [Clostridium frigidicarnis]|uniref:Uncharacterized protein n=1 Tax=Clostridium frigidicarnis TaxID=84698 RepID=A0A1I0Z047_9CLOT|nr:hypothetical protein [Clostridium frigidicarnis]SFB18792.1 hypothetical protein SAMN04488528_101659 [Clostridium frigidicarnis]